ncbi:hypothetical protein [Evansella vedderi]|nr:hypothetical protein [Evansella vedderi]
MQMRVEVQVISINDPIERVNKETAVPSGGYDHRSQCIYILMDC